MSWPSSVTIRRRFPFFREMATASESVSATRVRPKRFSKMFL